MKAIKTMGQRCLSWWHAGGQVNQNEISYFDVKVLYDAAFEEKDRARASLATFKSLMAQAEALEAAYRAQLKAQQIRLYGKAA